MPMKIVLKLIYNGILGGIALVLINFIGGFFQYHLALNIGSALVAGFLGIPGIGLLVVLKLIFGV